MELFSPLSQQVQGETLTLIFFHLNKTTFSIVNNNNNSNKNVSRGRKKGSAVKKTFQGLVNTELIKNDAVIGLSEIIFTSLTSI